MARTPSIPDSCNVLLIGNGGREHALAWKLCQSPRLGKLFASAPTNAGIASIAQLCDLEFTSKNAFRINSWCNENNIHFIIIGPEAPLADGLSDALRTPSRIVFGPTKEAARIEFDKAFSKTLMRSAAIPTAEARQFSDYESAHNYVSAHEEPCVVKASGLAAGKGAIVCNTQAEALAAIERMFVKREFGNAADTVLIEEKLQG
ncbi:MAG TPA: hypothetical protein VG711_01380, partial [Phycisphaerales bacterium]|nr:hypothetical protein [Phycisphaerales bacterium]